MELKPGYLCPSGYKQTEVGVIPDDWQVETINQLLEDKSILGHLDGNHGELYPKSSEFKQHGVPYIGANDFAEGFVTFERCKFLSKERAAHFRKGVAKDGDVLFAHNATVGPVALLKTSEPIIILSTTATYFRCNEEKLSNIYLKSALHAPHFVKQYQAVMAQSTRFQVPITAQRKLSLVIPPLSEQRAIAGALSDVDALIGSLDQLIAKKRYLKQATMQQLLAGQTRLPSFHGEWEVKRLGDIASLNRLNVIPASLPTQMFAHFSLPAFDAGKASVIEPGAAIGSNKFRVPQGAVLVSKLNPRIPRIWAPDDIPLEAIASTEFLILTPREGTSRRFLFVLCSSPLFCEQMELAATGTTGSHQRISPGGALSLKVSVPVDVEEQTAIAEVLSDMDAELAVLEQRRGKTRALKQGMMQELLTGRTRLV